MAHIFPIPISDSDQRLFSASEEAANLASDMFRSGEVIYAEPPRVPTDSEADSVHADFSVGRNEDLKWSKTQERSFSRMAAKIATRKATSEEQNKFKELQPLRRRTRNALTSEEILFDFKRRQLEGHLIASLHKYVEFLETPRRSKA